MCKDNKILSNLINRERCDIHAFEFWPLRGVFIAVILSCSLPLFSQIGYVMQVTMGTTPVESVVAAGTIFLGQVTKRKRKHQ